ncbi:ATP-binding mismatch repair protein [Marasmius tenuissimus]|nr:ATP-binding mismatch repair protein [Marasmius tenuissimus]
MPVPNNVPDEDDSDKELPPRDAAGTVEADTTECTPPPVSRFQPSAPLTSDRGSSSPNAPSGVEVDPRVTTVPVLTPLSSRAPNKPPPATPGSAIAATTTFGVESNEYHATSPPSPVPNPVSTGTGQGGAVDGVAGGRKQRKGELRREVVISTVGANWTQKVGLSVPKDGTTGGRSSADQDSDHDELDDDLEPPRKKRKSVGATAGSSDEEVQVVGERLAGKSSRGFTTNARKPEASRQLKLTDAFQPRTARQGMRNILAGFARSGSQMPPPIDDLEEEIEDHEMDTVGDNGGNTGPKSGSQSSPEPTPLFLPDEDGDTAMEDAATSSSLAPATTSSSLSASHPPTSSSVLPASSSSSLIDLTPDSEDEEIDGSVMSSVAPNLRSSGPNPDAIERPEVIRTTSSQASGDVHLRFSLSDITDAWSKLREKLKHAKETSDLTSRSYGASKTPPAAKDGPMADHMVAEATLSRVIEKRDFGEMDVLGQFNLGFIIVRKRGCGTIDGPTGSKAAVDPTGRDFQDDLFIVDQHAADEKYNFETLQQTHTIKSQKLLRPIALDLAASDEVVAVENLGVLKRNGFELHAHDDGGDGGGDGHTSDDMNGERHGARVSMTALPISKGTVFDMKDLEELIHLLSDKPRGQMVRCSKARAMFASRACRKSVMVGMPLTKGQMKTVIQHMGTMDQPWNCPHGRPTMRHLYDMSGKKLQHSRDVDWSTFA